MKRDNSIYIGVQAQFDENVFPHKSENTTDRLIISPPSIPIQRKTTKSHIPKHFPQSSDSDSDSDPGFLHHGYT